MQSRRPGHFGPGVFSCRVWPWPGVVPLCMVSEDLAVRREAYERRVWRLATLLSGDQHRAAQLALRIVDTRASLEDLDAPRLDRLVILTARRWRDDSQAGSDAGSAASGEASERQAGSVPDAEMILRYLRSQPFQQGEVWILRRVDALEDIRASQAMDCSRSAAGRFLERAEADLLEHFGRPSEELASIVRDYADGLEPGPVISARRAELDERRRRRRTMVIVVLLGGALIGVLALLRWLNQASPAVLGTAGTPPWP